MREPSPRGEEGRRGERSRQFVFLFRKELGPHLARKKGGGKRRKRGVMKAGLRFNTLSLESRRIRARREKKGEEGKAHYLF